MRKSLIAAFAFVGLTLALLSPSLALEKITLAQGIPQLTPAFAFSSSVPTELGFFKEEGLEVEVATTPGTAAAMQLVVGKRVDVAMGNPIGAMIAISERRGRHCLLHESTGRHFRHRPARKQRAQIP